MAGCPRSGGFPDLGEATVFDVNWSTVQSSNTGSLHPGLEQRETRGTLLRISGADCGSSHWAATYTYDAWGNINKSQSLSFVSQGGTGNHVPGFTYDADGNVLNDTFQTYTYNVYGRPATVGGSTTAVYDAFSRLVEVQGGANTQLLYRPDGYKFAFMNGQNVQKYFVPLPGGVQAVYTAAKPAAPAYWRHVDWLGSTRLESTPSQTVAYDGAYAPFGENYAETGTTDRSFTGQTQDSASGLYDFLFRKQSSAQGRWLVPDPAGLAAVDITNPQTWNRYAYVHNNPLNAIDPLGLEDCATDPDSLICDGGNGAAGGVALCDPYSVGFGSDGWGTVMNCGSFVFHLPTDPIQGPGSGGGSGSGSGTASAPPPPPPPSSVNYGDESLGIPGGLQHPWGVWSAIIPNGNCADMGPCAGTGFGPGGLVFGSVLCQFLEPCGAIEDILLVGVAIGEAGIILKNKIGEEADCAKEWEDAYNVCRELLSRPNPPRRMTGGHTDLQGCARGFVSEACGGNPIDWGGKK